MGAGTTHNNSLTMWIVEGIYWCDSELAKSKNLAWYILCAYFMWIHYHIHHRFWIYTVILGLNNHYVIFDLIFIGSWCLYYKIELDYLDTKVNTVSDTVYIKYTLNIDLSKWVGLIRLACKSPKKCRVWVQKLSPFKIGSF